MEKKQTSSSGEVGFPKIINVILVSDLTFNTWDGLGNKSNGGLLQNRLLLKNIFVSQCK